MQQQTCNIRFRARATGNGVGLQVRLNDQEIKTYRDLPTGWTEIFHTFPDEEVPYKLEIQMFGKTDEHTQVDDEGNIESDVVIEVADMSLDEIELGQVFYELAEYHHNSNGYGDWVKESFYGTMGCNGNVELEFHGPVYLWLLENM